MRRSNSTNSHKKKPIVREYIIGEPEMMDVLCGNKKRSFTEHPGSKRFAMIVEKNLQLYNHAITKQEKSFVIRQIAQEAQQGGARFLLRDSEQRWYLATRRAILDKVGHALRNELSSVSKNRKRHLIRKASCSSSCSSDSESSCATAPAAASAWEPLPIEMMSRTPCLSNDDNLGMIIKGLARAESNARLPQEVGETTVEPYSSSDEDDLSIDMEDVIGIQLSEKARRDLQDPRNALIDAPNDDSWMDNLVFLPNTGDNVDTASIEPIQFTRCYTV